MGERTTVIFGGTGFLGRAVARCMSARGLPLRVAARRPEAGDLPAAAARCRADVQDDDELVAAIGDAGAVVNAVSLYLEGGGLDFEAIHVEGAARVARLARAAGVERLVHLSGIGVDPDSPSGYVRARALGEQRVREAFPGAIVLRPSVLFGRHDSFLATLDRVTQLPVIPLFGAGAIRMQPAWVEDVAAAVTVAATGPEPAAETFELGGRDILRYREILEAVLRHRGRRRLLLPLPYSAWLGLARASALLSRPPVTRDQVVLMQTDNVVGDDVATFADLGIDPHGLLQRLGECLPD